MDDPTRAKLVVRLRQAAHGLEMGYFGCAGEDPFPELVELLDQAADELKVAWVERETLSAIRQLLYEEPSEAQKKELLVSFDRQSSVTKE